MQKLDWKIIKEEIKKKKKKKKTKMKKKKKKKKKKAKEELEESEEIEEYFLESTFVEDGELPNVFFLNKVIII